MISRVSDCIIIFIHILSAGAFHNKYCQLQCFENLTNTVCTRGDQKCGPDPVCGTDFRVIKLSNDDRQYILDIHNYLRNKVALGHEKRGEQPSAANMNAMSYDRELEFIAQCWANACKGNPLVHDVCRRSHKFEYVGQNLGSVSSTSPNIDLVKSLKELILGWYDEVADYNSTWIDDTRPREKEIGHYTQLIWASTTTIGCAVSYYSTVIDEENWYVLLLVCDYGPGGNYLGSPVYRLGKPCTECPKGRALKNKVYQGLCGVDIRVNSSDLYEDAVF
ncbi:unnamed protein product [Phaedon cochleariae]|uniref:SCP domain-containing protein n=1 Tax=Phaedon cochleariae TaxID=80249 RepID=A0A9P0DNQ5_PHACE|nr:unnamed protein product [Phaedon cochleariae]